jgi:hypothetical protein
MPKTAAFTPIKPALERKSARKRTKKEKKRFFVFVFLVVVDEPIVVVVVVFSKGVRRVVLSVVRCIRMTIETSKVSARVS